jgi:hypothetical protein
MTTLIDFVKDYVSLAVLAFGLYWIIRSAIEDAG